MAVVQAPPPTNRTGAIATGTVTTIGDERRHHRRNDDEVVERSNPTRRGRSTAASTAPMPKQAEQDPVAGGAEAEPIAHHVGSSAWMAAAGPMNVMVRTSTARKARSWRRSGRRCGSRRRATPVDRRALSCSGRHHSSTHSTPRNDAALTTNAHCAPADATSAPPSAGPTARPTLNVRLDSATACPNSSGGTRSGWMACQAGPISAAPTPSANVNARKRRSDEVGHRHHPASNAAHTSIHACVEIRTARRSEDVGDGSRGQPRSRIGSRRRLSA